jgi:hypothetical protein
MVNRKKMIIALGCLVLLTWIGGCGGEGEPDSFGLSLTFAPRDLPQDTSSIRFYALLGDLSDGSTAACEDFMGSGAPKSVLDYFSDRKAYGEELVDDLTGVTINIPELPEGTLMFYVEAITATGSTLACGCGLGDISKGDKTVIPIRLVTDCRI